MKKIMAVLCAVLIFMAAGEIFTRVLQHQHVIYNFSKGEHNVGVKRFETFSPKLIKSDNPVLYLENDPSDPLVNALGMRGALVSVAKPANTYRIAVIGDSVSFGFGVKLEDSFPYILEADLRSKEQYQGKNVEVINFSVNGYGLETYREVLLKKAEKFEPDLVIIGYCLNDLASADAVFVAVGDMMKKNAGYKNLAKYSQFLAAVKFYSDKAWDKTAGEWQFRRGYKDPRVDGYLKTNFEQIVSFGKAHNVAVLVVVFPLFTNFQNYGLLDIHNKVNGALDNAGVLHIDLLGAFKDQSAESLRLNKEDVTHPNAVGHQRIAKAIEDALPDALHGVTARHPESP
jgi:lysophospholipase L1-like esterase